MDNDRLMNIVQPICVDLGFDLGKSFHLIGCNNSDAYLFNLSPRPATIDINPTMVGARAVQQLIWRISHPRLPRETVVLAPNLVT